MKSGQLKGGVILESLGEGGGGEAQSPRPPHQIRLCKDRGISVSRRCVPHHYLYVGYHDQTLTHSVFML